MMEPYLRAYIAVPSILRIPHEPTKGYMKKKSEPVATQHMVRILRANRGDLSRMFYSTNLGITISGANQKGGVPWGLLERAG